MRLLEMLSRGEACVTAISASTGEDLSTVSQRLLMLCEKVLVVGRWIGEHVYCALSNRSE